MFRKLLFLPILLSLFSLNSFALDEGFIKQGVSSITHRGDYIKVLLSVCATENEQQDAVDALNNMVNNAKGDIINMWQESDIMPNIKYANTCVYRHVIYGTGEAIDFHSYWSARKEITLIFKTTDHNDLNDIVEFLNDLKEKYKSTSSSMPNAYLEFKELSKGLYTETYEDLVNKAMQSARENLMSLPYESSLSIEDFERFKLSISVELKISFDPPLIKKE